MSFDNPYFPQTFDVGTPGAGHIHFGQDGSLTLFAADGVSVDASLDPVNGLQVFKGAIIGALVETAAAGARVMFDGTGVSGPRDSVVFFNGVNDPAGSITRAYAFDGVDFGGNDAVSFALEAAAIAAPAGANGAGIRMTGAAVNKDAWIQYGTQGLQAPGAHHTFYGPITMAPGSNVTDQTFKLPVTAVMSEQYQALAMQNGWVNHGGGYSVLGIEQHGAYVVLKGNINSGTFTGGTVIANLPAAYRPDGHRVFPVVVAAGGPNDVFGALTINATTGDLVVDYLPGNNPVYIQTMWSVR